ncbi:uncharacterized protein LOC129595248 [Paramacrobiotus metropolitanus]|uniref:uncharacterized protein LOC129595248 n=1 Tax=Paramacrobiotus metropolitanus TaxID=2943436 RepID=UPI0024463294|nr:uncharacterized protein LOC129595248 [Paramacrobiotus metropolitanus]
MSRRRFGNNHRWANAVPAGAEDDDDNDGLIDDEPDDRLEKFGEIQISRMVEEEEDEPCLEEEMLFGRPRRAQPVAPAFHAWSSLGVNERSSDEEEPYFMKSQALAMPGKQVHQPDTRTDRDLVDFLRAFDCEEAYDVLQQRGISLRQLLEMTDDDISDVSDCLYGII